MVKSLWEPPGFFVGLEELFQLFGLFLMIVIGLELLSSTVLFLDDHSFHAETMLLVALTAVTRKIVILDAEAIDPIALFGLGFLLISLAVGYFVVRGSRPKQSLPRHDLEDRHGDGERSDRE